MSARFFFACICICTSLITNPAAATDIERMAPPLARQVRIKASDASAETLYSINHSQLSESGLWTRRSYYSIRINDQAAARDYGRISISYNHYYSDMTLEYANVMSAGGELKPVAEDAIQLRVTGGGQDFYDDRSEMVFSLPDVAPGSVIEFQYVTQSKRRAITTLHNDSVSPYWYQRRVAGDGWRADRVQHFSYVRKEPLSIHFQNEVYGSFKSSPKVAEENGVRTSTWEWNKIPTAELEASMLPGYEIRPAIISSTSSDWSLVDRWSWEQIADKLEKTAALTKIVKQLGLDKNASREQKLKAVYGYMQNNIRYVFAHLGRGGYEPHFPDEAIKNGYGDCKDQAVMAVALLRLLGVEAYPVLVETSGSGKSKTNLARLIFDHMIVWVAPDGELPAVWMDTTGDRALYPGISPFMNGQPALIVNGQGGRLLSANADLEPNVVTLDLTYFQNDKNQTVVEAVYSGTGMYEDHLRQWWKHDNNRDTSMQKFLGGIFENKGQYTLTSEMVNAENLFEPVKLKARFTFTEPFDGEEGLAYGTSFGQIYSLAGEGSSLQVPETRKNIWYSPDAIEMRINSRFVGTKQVLPAVLASSKNITNPFFELTQQGKTEGTDYRVNIVYKRRQLRLSVEEYGAYYRALIDLGNLGGWTIGMVDDPAEQMLEKDDKLVAAQEKGTADYQMALARRHLDTGDFDKALTPAEKAVKLAPKNGEAWYVLGTAQGFNALIEESNASFEKARQFGYTP